MSAWRLLVARASERSDKGIGIVLRESPLARRVKSRRVRIHRTLRRIIEYKRHRVRAFRFFEKIRGWKRARSKGRRGPFYGPVYPACSIGRGSAKGLDGGPWERRGISRFLYAYISRDVLAGESGAQWVSSGKHDASTLPVSREPRAERDPRGEVYIRKVPENCARAISSTFLRGSSDDSRACYARVGDSANFEVVKKKKKNATGQVSPESPVSSYITLFCCAIFIYVRWSSSEIKSNSSRILFRGDSWRENISFVVKLQVYVK